MEWQTCRTSPSSRLRLGSPGADRMTTFLIIVALVFIALIFLYRQTLTPVRRSRRYGTEPGGNSGDGITVYLDTDRDRGDCHDVAQADSGSSDGGSCGGDGGGGGD